MHISHKDPMNLTTCLAKYPRNQSSGTENYCPTVFDSYLCWPSIAGAQNATQECPDYPALARRYCLPNGTWFNDQDNNTNGHTYYDDCMPVKILGILKFCNKLGEQNCQSIGNITRNIEIIGLTVSLTSLIISLYIFHRHRILKNNRTKIHKNLFLASLLQITIRLVIYLERGFKDRGVVEGSLLLYIEKCCTPILEYTKTAMFLWMFIEGFYLHNMVTVTLFQEYSHIKIYFFIGWSLPAVMTGVWLFVMIYSQSDWTYYYFISYYWILEGPRCGLIFVNLLFLLNIIRVLIVKLRKHRAGEFEQVKKAVRAALFLLPLLGIPNLIFLVDYHKFRKPWQFAFWSYTAYSFTSFHGFFVAFLYCFLNGEVQTAIKNSFYLRRTLRNNDYYFCRNLTVVSTANAVDERDEKITTDAPWFQKCFNNVSSPEEKNESTKGPWSNMSKDATESTIIEDTQPEETKV